MNRHITFEVVATAASLRDEWDRLDREAQRLLANGTTRPVDYTFYQTFGWNAFVEAHFRASTPLLRAGKRIEYILVRSGAELLAILPLKVRSYPMRIEFPSWKTSGVNNICCPRASDPTLRQVWDRLCDFVQTRYRGAEVRLFDIPSGSPFCDAMLATGTLRGFERESWHIPLGEFDGFDQYYASLSKKLRHNIQTRSNHFTHGDLSCSLRVIEPPESPTKDDWNKLWGIFFRRKIQWHGKSQTLLRRLYSRFETSREVATGLKTASFAALPQSRLFVFEINGEPAAFTFLYQWGPWIVVPKLAIDFTYRTHAPGILMLREVMKWCFAHGVRDFDLCRGDEPYKQQMGAVCTMITRIKGHIEKKKR